MLGCFWLPIMLLLIMPASSAGAYFKFDSIIYQGNYNLSSLNNFFCGMYVFAGIAETAAEMLLE